MAPMKNYISLSKLALIVALVFSATALVGCQASDETKQGAEGEYCNGHDDECRGTMECRDFVCVAGDPGPCDRLCERLDECDASLESCVTRCKGTTEHWSEQSVDTYENCFMEGRTCEQLRETEDPPQDCYYELPLEQERADLCHTFVNEAGRVCNGATDAVEELSDQCRIFARTRTDDEWTEKTDPCVDRVEDEVCTDIFDCLSQTFRLEEQF